MRLFCYYNTSDAICLLSYLRFVASTQGSDALVSEEERAFREQEAQILENISAPPINSEDALKKLVADRKSPKKKDG